MICIAELLNVGPKPNGEFPEQAVAILREIGKWLRTNGEAIYGTTPWMVYGEGPTKMKKEGPFNEDVDLRYTSEDIRFTVKDNVLYAISLGVPRPEPIIKSIPNRLYSSEIEDVGLLGCPEKPKWVLSEQGLVVTILAAAKLEHAVVCKIVRRPPFTV